MEVSSPPEYARTMVPFPMMDLLSGDNAVPVDLSAYMFEGQRVSRNSTMAAELQQGTGTEKNGCPGVFPERLSGLVYLVTVMISQRLWLESRCVGKCTCRRGRSLQGLSVGNRYGVHAAKVLPGLDTDCLDPWGLKGSLLTRLHCCRPGYNRCPGSDGPTE